MLSHCAGPSGLASNNHRIFSTLLVVNLHKIIRFVSTNCRSIQLFYIFKHLCWKEQMHETMHTGGIYKDNLCTSRQSPIYNTGWMRDLLLREQYAHRQSLSWLSDPTVTSAITFVNSIRVHIFRQTKGNAVLWVRSTRITLFSCILPSSLAPSRRASLKLTTVAWSTPLRTRWVTPNGVIFASVLNARRVEWDVSLTNTRLRYILTMSVKTDFDILIMYIELSLSLTGSGYYCKKSYRRSSSILCPEMKLYPP